MDIAQLRRQKIWCGSYSIADKAPRQPSGEYALVDNPSTWHTYATIARAGFKLIGLVTNKKTGVTVIDCDDHDDDPATDSDKIRFRKIYNQAQSYTEISANGKGLHILVEGIAPFNFHRDHIELYSCGKYFILTGNTINDADIKPRKHLLTQLCDEIATAEAHELSASNTNTHLTDEALVEMANRAADSAKFIRLCNGDWQGEYVSQSEADLALFSILGYYTRDNAQVIRIFQLSKLGRRNKAKRQQYLDYNIRRMRSSEPARIDFTELKAALYPSENYKNVKEKNSVEQGKTQTAPSSMSVSMELTETWPCGLLGEVAEYITNSSHRPVAEVGLAAARSLLAGIVGTSHNISGTGLNIYQLISAKTGTGKEGASSGIDRILSAVRTDFPSIDKRVGPSNFASGQALLRTLDRQKCFVSIIGEFGQALQIMTDPRANSSEKTKLRILLDLYGKSGKEQTLRPNVYADSDKNTKLIKAPAVSILGEGTPESIYQGLDETMIANGLLPRFSIIEYNGKRVPTNPHALYPPTQALCRKLIALAKRSAILEEQRKVICIKQTKKATVLLKDFDSYCDNKINHTNKNIEVQLWNRGHLKALKLAALEATGHNIHNAKCIITSSIAKRAIRTIKNEVIQVMRSMRSEEYGSGNAKQEYDLLRIMQDYVKVTIEKRRQYRVAKKIVKEPNKITFDYLRRKTRHLKSFKEDRRGEVKALKDLLSELTEAGIIHKLDHDKIYQRYKINSAVYVLGSNTK